MSNILSIYIIYHKSTFIRNTEEFSADEIQKYFKWVAVNEKIPKVGDNWISVIRDEYEKDFIHIVTVSDLSEINNKFRM